MPTLPATLFVSQSLLAPEIPKQSLILLHRDADKLADPIPVKITDGRVRIQRDFYFKGEEYQVIYTFNLCYHRPGMVCLLAA